MTADEFKASVARALHQLGADGEAAIDGVAAETGDDGDVVRWTADVRANARPAASIGIGVAAGLDGPGLARELRAELRRALRMCPLCQRIGHVEKVRGATGQQEACAVRCPACGDFEIDQSLIRDLRSAWEREDRAVLDRLPAVSDALRQGGGARLTSGNWREVAKNA